VLKLYPRLALQNLRKNYRITVPYILSGCGIIMMYYMLYALCVGTQSSKFYGVTSAGAMLGLGIYIIAIFGAIFLFYTNSFLMKRRKKELGLYNILGMEKRHIAGVILTETLFTALICLFFGIGLGLAFSKAFFLILEKLLGIAGVVPFLIPPDAIINAVILFGCIRSNEKNAHMRRKVSLGCTRALHELYFVEREALPEGLRECEGYMEIVDDK